MVKKKAVLLIILFAFIGCDQKAIFEKFVPKEEIEFSKQYLALLQSRDFDAMERKISPDSKGPGLRPTLAKMADLFPSEPPRNINFAGSKVYTERNLRRVDLALEYEFPQKWLLVDLVLEKTGDLLVVKGIHIKPLPESLAKINRFTFQGKTPLHYIFFSLAIMVPLFIIFALVLCIKTPITKRKWLWIIFVLLGFVKITLNWTNGALNITPISFQLLGFAVSKWGPYAPWLVEVSLPVGAIVFLLKRKKWRAPVKPETNEILQPGAGGDE